MGCAGSERHRGRLGGISLGFGAFIPGPQHGRGVAGRGEFRLGMCEAGGLSWWVPGFDSGGSHRVGRRVGGVRGCRGGIGASRPGVSVRAVVSLGTAVSVPIGAGGLVRAAPAFVPDAVRASSLCAGRMGQWRSLARTSAPWGIGAGAFMPGPSRLPRRCGLRRSVGWKRNNPWEVFRIARAWPVAIVV